MEFRSVFNKNRARILSDNYIVKLYFKVGEKYLPETGLNLTELYGLTEFSYEVDDEIVIKKPVTRLEPIVTLKQKGANLDFTFIREEIPENDGFGSIINLLLSQYSILFNGMGTIDKPEKTSNLGTGNYKVLGQHFYTDLKNPSDRISRFSEPLKYAGIQAECKIEVRLKNYSTSANFEGVDFYAVTLYHLSEKVSENSSFVINSFKGYACYLERAYEGNGTIPNYFGNRVYETIDDVLKGVLNPSSLDYYVRRVIRNPSNKE
jgi:hypothetical protein